MNQSKLNGRIEDLRRRVDQLSQENREKVGSSRTRVDPVFEELSEIIQELQAATQAQVQQDERLADLQRTTEQAQRRTVEIEALFSQMTDGVLVYGPDGIPVRANAAVIHAFGFDPTGLSPVELAKYVGASRLDGTPWKPEEFLVNRALRGETVLDVRLRIVTAEGNTTLFSASANPIYDRQGKISGAVVTFHDVTERQRLEGENRRQKALLDAIFQAEPSGLAVVTGLELLFAYANPAYRFICPTPGEDLIGRPYEVIWSTEDPNCYADPIREVVQTGRPFQTLHFERKFPDGSLRTFTLQSRRIPWDDQPAALLALWDTTEVTKVEQALRDTQERMRMALTNSSISIYTLDRDLRYTWQYNLRAGFTPEQVLGKRDDELVPTPEMAEILAWKRQVMESGEGARREVHYQLGSQTVYSDVTIEPLRDARGNITGLLGSSMDITERKQSLLALEEAQAKAVNEKTRLAAMLEALPVAVAILDVEGGVIQVNPMFDRIWSGPLPATRSVEDYGAYQAWWIDSGQPVQPEEWASARAVQRGESVVGQELRIQRFDGTYAVVINSAVPIHDAKGQIVGCVVAILDITERREAEAALQAEEATLRGILDATKESIWLFDPDGTILMANQTALARLNRQAEEVIGRNFSQFVTAELAQARQARIQQVIGTGQPVEFEDERGSIHFQHSFYPVIASDGRCVSVVSFSRDITERKRAEVALLRSDQRISTIFTSITDCCYTLDPEWRFTTVNVPAVDYFHKTREELLGQVFWEIFPQTVGSFIEHNYRKAVQEQAPIHYETRSPISGLWVEVHAYPSAEGLFVILRDVTARKVLEENLQESEQRYRDLIRYAPVGIYEIDFHKQRFTSINDVMCQLTGYTRPELLEMNPFDLLDDQGKKSFQDRIQAWLAGEKPANTVEYRVKAKDGHTIYADLSVTFTSDENGKPIGATVIGYDLTERKQAEQALRDAVQAAAQSQRDAEASEARERARVAELETLMDVVPAIVWVSHDRDCREMTGNRYGSDFLKMWATANLSKTAPDSALQQQPYRIFKDGREIPPEEMPMQIAARTGLSTQDYEFDLVFNDGSTRTVLGNVKPLLDEAGEPTGAIGAFMDITERKLAEEMLGTSEKRLWALLEHSPDGIVVVGIDGTVTFVSPSTTRILGYTPDDLLGKLPFDLIHPEEQEEAIALFTQFAGSPDQVNHAFQRLQHKDGSWRVCEFTISNLLDEPGINGIVANYRDVTESKLAEQVLGEALLSAAQSEEREKARRAELEAVMDAVPAIIWITHDPQAQEMTGNRTILDLMRLQPGDNLSKTEPNAEKLRHFKILRDGQEIPPEQLPIQVAASTGKPVLNDEFDMIFADGKTHHLLGNAEPLTDEQGNPSGAVGAFIDITEREQSEKRIQKLVQELAQRNAELEAERQRWKALVEGIADEVWACDTQGRMTLMSLPDVTLMDFKVSKGKTYLEILDEVDILTPDGQLRPEGQAPLIRSLKGEISRGEEIMRHRRTGQTRYRHYSSAPIRDADGTILGAVAVIRDITELKQAENTANLRASQVEMQHRLMDQRERERQQIARDLHDGPMQEILGAIYSLKGKMLDISDKDLANDLQQVVETLHLQLAEMRSYASELRPPSLAKFGLEKAIASYLNEWQDKHPDIQTQFKSDPTKQPLPEVVGLPLFRIFQQALANIVHHSQASQVTVRLEKKSGKVVRLTIQDNGVGFALPKDWLNLARAGHLGLVGMRERAEAIGGDLEIQSEPGQGTQIRVTVPLP